MTERLSRSVIEPVNPKLNVSRNANLPHSPGIRVGDYIFLSGMGPVDPATGGRNLGPIAEQIHQTLRNMAHMLESAGSGLDRIVKMTVVLADSTDYDEMNLKSNRQPAASSILVHTELAGAKKSVPRRSMSQSWVPT
jgi:enamine deaminase RidA (YjgF/YER057c/UK114 family)